MPAAEGLPERHRAAWMLAHRHGLLSVRVSSDPAAAPASARMRALALALMLAAGCATGRPCSTVAVVPNEWVVLHCPDSGARNGIVVIRWSELTGPWPTPEGIRR